MNGGRDRGCLKVCSLLLTSYESQKAVYKGSKKSMIRS